MTGPSRTNSLPTLAQRTPELTTLFWGGTGTAGTLLGQVQTFSWTDGIESRDTYRVGDSTKYRAYTSEDVTWQLTLYEDTDIQEVALLMGSTRATSGWAGSESIEIDTSTATTTASVVSWTSEATTGTLLWYETLTGVKVTNIQRQVTGGQDNNMWQFSGTATEVTITPIAGT